MIQSMTGFGKADAHFNGKKIHVEVKSLNSKAMDLNTRIAPLYREKEMEIRQLLSKALERGKVDFTLWVEKDETSAAGTINPVIVANYVSQIRQISKEQSLPEPQNVWDLVLRLPETTQTVVTEELSADEWQVVLGAVNEAVSRLVDFRKQEGAALYLKFTEKVDNIERYLGEIEPYEKGRVEKIRQRLTDRLAELKGVDYDKNRLEQELIYYIEKLDISEEKQRLANHLRYFRETMKEEGRGQGKKLGFIAQEMGREINTTGSKSNQAEMQNIVVKMKDELEQIKEQVLNVM
ncbi:MAG: YicC family protein [Prevotella sp.]|nr:YicC family protein [Prevotella sp.]MDY5665986.1 YicC/YloC family endoribonuclease [Alloprevotella sp.]